jgi:RNA polymerase sigma-70 factor, ECF subfamily
MISYLLKIYYLHISKKAITIEISQAISMIKAKNEQGLSLVYDSYSDALYGIIFRIVRKEEESKEVLQNVFLKVWNNIHSFDESKSTIFTWMASIAKNNAIDVCRSKGFKNEKNNQSLSLSDYDLKASTKVNNGDVEKITKSLPEKYKILIDKMFLEGYTQQEISEHFEMPLGTVKTRLREAMNLLRQEFKNEKHLLYFLTIIP